MFALDVFSEERGLWRILAALSIHLIPSSVLIAGLILAWRWEGIGAALYAAAGVHYVATAVGATCRASDNNDLDVRDSFADFHGGPAISGELVEA